MSDEIEPDSDMFQPEAPESPPEPQQEDESDQAAEGWGAKSATVELEPPAKPRGYRYAPDEKAVILKKVQDLQALGEPLVKALAMAGITYATYNRWLEDPSLRPPQSKPNPPREPVVSRVPLPSGVEPSPYALTLDARDLVAANRAAIVAALTIGKHESVKAAITALLES